MRAHLMCANTRKQSVRKCAQTNVHRIIHYVTIVRKYAQDNVCAQLRAKNVRAQIRAHRDFSVCAHTRKLLRVRPEEPYA